LKIFDTTGAGTGCLACFNV